jgi:hypothetical protein
VTRRKSTFLGHWGSIAVSAASPGSIRSSTVHSWGRTPEACPGVSLRMHQTEQAAREQMPMLLRGSTDGGINSVFSNCPLSPHRTHRQPTRRIDVPFKAVQSVMQNMSGSQTYRTLVGLQVGSHLDAHTTGRARIEMLCGCIFRAGGGGRDSSGRLACEKRP